MTAVTGRAAGFIATVYHSPTVIATKDESTIEAAIISANLVKDVATMGSLDKTRNIIDVPVYGQDVAGKLAGQADPGTFDLNVTFDMSDTKHKALRDDTGRIEGTWIVQYEQSSTAKTYAAFDGFTANASVGQPIDDRIQMDVSVARSGDITWIDNS